MSYQKRSVVGMMKPLNSTEDDEEEGEARLHLLPQRNGSFERVFNRIQNSENREILRQREIFRILRSIGLCLIFISFAN